MKKVLALIIALMFTFTAIAAFAADKAKKATVTGKVIAIDAKANTLTVKGTKKGEVALTADAKTMITAGKDKKSLADVKAGDKVAVAYTEADGKNIANKIAIKEAAKAAPAPVAAPKPEEKKPAPAKKAAGY